VVDPRAIDYMMLSRHPYYLRITFEYQSDFRESKEPSP
jgi:hypothetical protein